MPDEPCRGSTACDSTPLYIVHAYDGEGCADAHVCRYHALETFDRAVVEANEWPDHVVTLEWLNHARRSHAHARL